MTATEMLERVVAEPKRAVSSRVARQMHTITRRKYTALLLVLGTIAALLAGIAVTVGSAIIVSLIESNPL